MNKALICSALALTTLLAGCRIDSDTGSDTPERWQDLGSITVHLTGEDYYLRPMLRIGDDVLVGTPNGIKRRNLRSAAEWQSSGLDGFAVHSIKRAGNVLIATGEGRRDPGRSLYRSTDNGKTWTAAQSVPAQFESTRAEPIYDLVVSPANPDLIYFNLSGPSVAVSTDGGRNVRLVNDMTDTYFGYPCVLQFINDKADKLYQGCEMPLDDAWVGYYTLDARTPDQIGELKKIADGWNDAYPKLENRRPNSMASAKTHGDRLFVGVEGGLVRFDNENMQWLFKAVDGGDPVERERYAYIRSIGLDAGNPQRLFFGGQLNGENKQLQFYVTSDGGQSVQRIPGPSALKDPHLVALTEDGPGQWLVLIAHHPVTTEQQLQLFRYRH